MLRIVTRLSLWDVQLQYPQGDLPYEKDGDAPRLTEGCKLQKLVPLKMLRTEQQYF